MSDTEVHGTRGGWLNCCSCPISVIILIIAIVAGLQYTGVIPRLLRSLLHTFFSKFLPVFHKHFNAHMSDHKKTLFAGLANDFDSDGKLHIVEIGAGAGANFKFFPRGARVTCIEPNDKMEKALMKSVEEADGAITLEKFHVGKAEHMTQFKDDSIDAVVSSLVMCSVDDVDATLKEVKRILKPGGKLYFIEHTLAEKGTLERLPQLFLLSLMKFMIQKNINRDAYVNIYRAGFSDVQLEFYDAVHLKQTVPWWIRPFVATRYYQGIIKK